jgi:hypothetical protein
MDQGEVYFLKMNSGEDLLCKLVDENSDFINITQPYRVEMMQAPGTMTVTTAIMRWIPFDSLMEQTISINKKNVLTYMLVDDIVAGKYINTISEHSKREHEAETARIEEIRRLLMIHAINRVANSNISGTFH